MRPLPLKIRELKAAYFGTVFQLNQAVPDGILRVLLPEKVDGQKLSTFALVLDNFEIMTNIAVMKYARPTDNCKLQESLPSLTIL